MEIRDFGDEAAKVVLYPRDDLRIIENKAAYLHKDQLGSVRVVTDDLGKKENTFAYTPFGEQKNWPHKVTTHSEEKSYIGQRYDQDAGLLYLNARYMDPALGLFVQPDWFEISRPGVGLNRYSYALNDPVNLYDPNGNIIPIVVGGAVLAWRVYSAYETVRSASKALEKLSSGEYTFVDAASAIAVNAVAGRVGDKAIKGGYVLVSKALAQRHGLRQHRRRVGEFINSFCSSSSFAPGTLVATEDGLVPIESLEAGASVMARDHDGDGTDEVSSKVISEILRADDRPYARLVFENADGELSEVMTTPEHPFFVFGLGWVTAKDLRPGYQLSHLASGDANSHLLVRSLSIDGSRGATFNLEVEDYHSFFVAQDGVWVHNGRGVRGSRPGTTVSGTNGTTIGLGSGSGRYGNKKSNSTHIIYRGFKNGKPYIGRASGRKGMSANQILRRRYSSGFGEFDNSRTPRILHTGLTYQQARGLEYLEWEANGGSSGTSNKNRPGGGSRGAMKKVKSHKAAARALLRSRGADLVGIPGCR